MSFAFNSETKYQTLQRNVVSIHQSGFNIKCILQNLFIIYQHQSEFINVNQHNKTFLCPVKAVSQFLRFLSGLSKSNERVEQHFVTFEICCYAAAYNCQIVGAVSFLCIVSSDKGIFALQCTMIREGVKNPRHGNFPWGGPPPPGASTDENFPKS